MVIRLVVVPDYLGLADFDGVFHAVLGWESGIGYAFQVHGQEFNSFRRRTPSDCATWVLGSNGAESCLKSRFV